MSVKVSDCLSIDKLQDVREGGRLFVRITRVAIGVINLRNAKLKILTTSIQTSRTMIVKISAFTFSDAQLFDKNNFHWKLRIVTDGAELTKLDVYLKRLFNGIVRRGYSRRLFEDTVRRDTIRRDY